MAPYSKSAAYYDLIYESACDYEQECNLLERIFREYGGRKVREVLDLGCGTGNHATILSSRGYEVLGIDVSEQFIQLAREKARSSKRPPEFRIGDMTNLTLEGRFDALLSMFGAFGYVHRVKLPEVLSSFAEMLREGGLLLFEFWNRLGAKPRHKSWLERESGELRLLRLDKSGVDFDTGVLEINMKHYIMQGGKLEDVFEETHRMTTYLRKEMRAYLRGAGFQPVAMLDWDRKVLEAPRRTTFRIFAVAKLPDSRRGAVV